MTFISEQQEEEGIQWRGIADCILDKNGEFYKMVLEQIRRKKEALETISKQNKTPNSTKGAYVSTRKISRFGECIKFVALGILSKRL